MDDLISRQYVIGLIRSMYPSSPILPSNRRKWEEKYEPFIRVEREISKLPSAQPEQRYTEEELMVFKHGISLSLLSKRSSQHWQYDEDTATEIKFLERLYEKVSADMRGEQDG